MRTIKLPKSICLVSILVIATACLQLESVETKKNRLSKEHGLLISAGEPETFFVAPYTKADANISEAVILPASSSVLRESMQGIEDALSCYPQGFVSSMIDAIFISGEMWFEGKRAGGTYGYSWIIVASSTKQEGYESNYETAYYGVHHELSSFVFYRLPMVGIAWAELMPAEWQPAISYSAALGVDSLAEPDYENGFLSKYAETSIENDFNTYAEYAFGNPEKLAELASNYPLIAAKLRLFIGAYTIISPALEPIFRQTSLESSAAPESGLIEIIKKIEVPKLNPAKVEKLM